MLGKSLKDKACQRNSCPAMASFELMHLYFISKEFA
jgi:hypothetical protein